MDRSKEAKAHAFDKGYSVALLESCWEKLRHTNHIIKSLHRTGMTWQGLPPHLIDDLVKRGTQEEGQ